LLPWPRRRRSGPPPWPGCRRAHARARTHTRNHAGACLERSRPSLWPPFAPDLVGTPSRHRTRLCCRGKSFLPRSASASSIPFLRTRSGARARQPGRRLPHLERNQSIQIATTSSLYFTSLLRTSFRLGAGTSGQVSARVRPHARTQANTPACHRGARRCGPATDMPACSSEDMDAAFGRPMLTTAHASSPHSSEAKSRPSTCCGVSASLIEPRRPTLSASDCSLSPPALCSRTPAPEGVEPYSPCPNGAHACSRARTPSQVSCHAAAGTPVATPRSSSRTEPFTIAPSCSSESFISRPHARACARPSCRLCSPCSSSVNTFTRLSRT
jgi:hypothetical protein